MSWTTVLLLYVFDSLKITFFAIISHTQYFNHIQFRLQIWVKYDLFRHGCSFSSRSVLTLKSSAGN